MSRATWLLVIALVGVSFGAGYWLGHKAAGAQKIELEEFTPVPPPTADLSGPAAESSAQAEPGEPTGPPQGDEATDAAQVAVGMAFPGWDVQVIGHSDDWQTATVRVTSPDGKASFDFDVEWQPDMAAYGIVRASGGALAGPIAPGGVRLPPGITAALKANPKLKLLAGGPITVERLTSSDALLTLSGGGQRWRVYLKRTGGGWVVKNAKRLG